MAKNVICLWYEGAAEEAARFYAQTFPDSAVTAVHQAPGDYPRSLPTARPRRTATGTPSSAMAAPRARADGAKTNGDRKIELRSYDHSPWPAILAGGWERRHIDCRSAL
jgi:3-demethylubiquinone-9 3-methyltransferase